MPVDPYWFWWHNLFWWQMFSSLSPEKRKTLWKVFLGVFLIIFMLLIGFLTRRAIESRKRSDSFPTLSDYHSSTIEKTYNSIPQQNFNQIPVNHPVINHPIAHHSSHAYGLNSNYPQIVPVMPSNEARGNSDIVYIPDMGRYVQVRIRKTKFLFCLWLFVLVLYCICYARVIIIHFRANYVLLKIAVTLWSQQHLNFGILMWQKSSQTEKMGHSLLIRILVNNSRQQNVTNSRS